MSDNDPRNPVPYSEATLALVAQIREARTSGERASLVMSLASQFASEHDPTDDYMNNEYHECFDEYHRMRLKFQQAALKVGRLAMQEVESYFEENNLPMPTAVEIAMN